MILSQGIGKLKNTYPIAKNLEAQNRFLSIHEYQVLAKKMLRKHAKKYQNVLPLEKVLKSEEILSEIMTALMKADWSWDETKSRQSYYRVKHVKWAILDIVNRTINHPKIFISQTDLHKYFDEDTAIKDMTCGVDNSYHLSQEELEDNEDKALKISQIKTIIPKVLSKQEQQCVKLYFFDGKPATDIASQLTISTQRVYQILNNATKTLKEFINV